MNPLKLNDLITEDFQNEIQDSFSRATGFGVIFTDAEGNHIGSKNNFCKFCKKINETPLGAFYCSCTNKNAIANALETKKPSIYICHAGLVNIEIPLIFENECIGAITAGNVTCLEKDLYPHEPTPKDINWLDDPDLAEYYNEISIVTKEQIEGTTATLSNITNYIIQTAAYAQTQRELAQRSDELLKEVTHRNKLEQQLKIAQLDALQKQVTPHFIFNVVNSISRLMSMEDYHTAQEMLNSFAQMMRYSLANVRTSVTLRQEIDYIDNYLAIQKIRFGNRIDYTIKCDNSLKDMLIPFFSIQPLVENAIEHGLLNKEIGGKLKLTCSALDGFILIQVMDNGIGICSNELTHLQKSLLITDQPGTQLHIGLYNCCQRFRLMFGNNVDFTIDSRMFSGTKINIRINK